MKSEGAGPVGVMFVLTSAALGGVEEVVLRLLQRLDRSEFRLALAAPHPLLDAFAPELAGQPVDALAVEAESWLRPGEVRRLGAFVDRFRPAVVNPHLFRSTAVAAPLARWHGVPAVVETYHGREGWRRGALRGSFAPDRVIARLVHRVIAVSEAARDFLVSSKGYPAGKIVVIPNGRDLSVFQPGRYREQVRKELGLDGSTPLVGVVGRLESQKGHTYLLQAWPEVLRQFPDARLLVIGEGSLRAGLEEEARARSGASVIFAGFRADVARLLDALDVLALPSLYEGMPLTAIEAAATARPVVATAVDGTPEVVRDGVTGRLVPPADPRVRLIRQEPRAGKSAALNRGAAAATGDVLIFTDANALFAADALARLAASFADSRVGLVSGQGLYGTTSGGDARAVGNGYVRYEAVVRSGESALGILAGADGAVYALRRSIWEPLHPADVNDLLHPLQAALAGYHSRFDPNASTIEPPSPDGGGELRRHVRIIAQGIHLLQRWLPHLVVARRWRLVWALCSHRVLRWSSALFLATAFVANVALLRPGDLYHLTLAVQLGFYGLALLGFLGERAGLRLGRLAIPYYFCVVSAAGVGGLARYLRRGAEAVWAPRGQAPARDRAA